MKSEKAYFPFSSRQLRAFKNFSASLRSETDRACAILAATMLDASLEKLLRKTLIPQAADDLFQPQGPLSTFYAKIILSSSIGLISNDECRELQLLRKIRNHFAHLTSHRLRFSSPAVVSLVKSLRYPVFFIRLAQEVATPKEYRKYRKNETPRKRFELSFVSMYLFLLHRISVAKRCKRPKGLFEPIYDTLLASTPNYVRPVT